MGEHLQKLSLADTSQAKDLLDQLVELKYVESYILWKNGNTVSERWVPGSTRAQMMMIVATLNDLFTKTIDIETSALDKGSLDELVRQIGLDLDIIRTLRMSRVKEVFRKIYEGGYLDGIDVWPSEEPITIGAEEDSLIAIAQDIETDITTESPSMALEGIENEAQPERKYSPPGSNDETTQNLVTGRLLELAERTNKRSLLTESKVEGVLKTAARLFGSDPSLLLQQLAGQWTLNVLQGQHALGLPKIWKGVDGAVNYIKLFDFEETIDPIAKRVAYVLLYINYRAMCREPEKYCERTRGRRQKSESLVLGCILDRYTNDPKQSRDDHYRRNRLTSGILRKARWWWRLTSSLGAGILLIGTDEMVLEM
ncbi:uncharacterized protein BDV14DRAFT_182269 [Aspergillus stella-maris]|uniref:uncharacterized protein n=1 Tax=Aspergillus stella-maris TaxID=1810926 RepID=UPI003CCCFEC5